MYEESKSEKAVDISELRIEIDQLNQKIISGLKDRSRYALNENVFEEEFFEGKTWFEYRLKKEQDLDSEFGRFLYYDQQPLMFSKEELEKAKVPEPKHKGVKPILIDFSKNILLLYKKTLKDLCKNIEDESTYGETTKLDVENVLTLNERTVSVGEQVAAYKISKEPELKNLKNEEEIRKKLVKPEREKQVISGMFELATNYGFEKPEAIKEFAKNLIQITLDAEVHFILNSE